MFRINPEAEYANQFEQIAKELFYKYELVVNDTIYQLVELEFYYHSPNHADPFVHMDDMQLKNGQWYFHGSGIDLTIGDNSNYGGILIRGMKQLNLPQQNYISGPLNVAKEIFKRFGSISLKAMNIGLIESEMERSFIAEDFVYSSRINLSKNNSESEYYKKKYRFITDINTQHSFKEKEQVANQLLADTNDVLLVNNKFGYKIV